MIPDHIEQVFESVPGSCGQARAFVTDALADVVAPGRLDDVRVATAEFATNAIEHAAGGTFKVTVDVGPGHVIVHVVDLGGGLTIPQFTGAPGLDAEGGRGLLLVGALTDAAGCVEASRCCCPPSAAGWCCWFRIDRPVALTFGRALACREVTS